jgi:hypothetical protein
MEKNMTDVVIGVLVVAFCAISFIATVVIIATEMLC